MIAVAVYVVGGCVYQRNVMHQRGWRQLPNYAIWAGVGSFVKVRPPPPLSFALSLKTPQKTSFWNILPRKRERGSKPH